jgi:RNA polymerase sigma-70 factor (ECF subfamily)
MIDDELESNCRSWIRDFQVGNKEAYRKLLRLLSERISIHLKRKIFDKDDQDDVLQEVLMGIHKALPSYDLSRPFRPWLSAIVHYKTVDYFRRKTKNSEEFLPPEKVELIPEPTQETSEKEEFWEDRREKLENVLPKLSKKQRQVFQLMKREGRTVVETALELGITISDAKVSSHRAMEKLKKLIKDTGEES